MTRLSTAYQVKNIGFGHHLNILAIGQCKGGWSNSLPIKNLAGGIGLPINLRLVGHGMMGWRGYETKRRRKQIT